MSFTRRGFVGRLTMLAAGLRVPGVRAGARNENPPAADFRDALKPDTILFMESPAAMWQDALPVGNGRMGAMVFGGARSERIALNDDTLWSGAPRDWNNPGAKQHLPIVRKLVLVDKNYQAADAECRKMEGPWNQSYEPLGDLLIDMEHGEEAGYVRSLDLDSAIAKVQYSADGVSYVREVFASFPDDVIVVRISASQPAKITAMLRMKSLLRSSTSAEGTNLLLVGKAPKQSLPDYLSSEPAVVYSDLEGEGMHFASVVHVNASGGKLEGQPDGSVHVTAATSLVLTVGCATGFKGFALAPDMPLELVVAKAKAAAARASTVPYEQLVERHKKDHQKLFRRVSLELPSTPDASLPTDKRVEAFAQRPDPSLLVLVFNLGRYLLISSSRPGSQPANLQGLWNGDVRPPWSCNWTTNINTEMNYWAVETCNLSECHVPLIEMVRDLSVNGAKTAEVNYGAPGWCAHHNVDLGGSQRLWGTVSPGQCQPGQTGPWQACGWVRICGSTISSTATRNIFETSPTP